MKSVLKSGSLGLRSIPLYCAGLFLRAGSSVPAPPAPRDILFIRLDRIGDMVLSTPALKAIKEKYPSARLSVLAAPAAAGLLDGNRNVDRVYLWEPGKGPAALLGVLRDLRAAGFDLAIDPHSGYEITTAVIAFLSGAAVRAGYGTRGRGIFFNLRAGAPAAGAHFSDEAFGVLKLLGMERGSAGPELFVTREAEAGAAAMLENAGAGKSDTVVSVHPGGHYPSQRWPAERFAAMITALISRHKAWIVLVGVSAEAAVTEKVLACLAPEDRKKVIKAVDLKTGLLCALIGRSRLFIGNNSGPLHMAGALKIPSVSTMGPTDENRWRPLGADQIVLKADLPCLSCGRGRCGPHECMADITTEMMLESAERLLAGNPGVERGADDA
jgi:heptosyltransferase-2